MRWILLLCLGACTAHDTGPGVDSDTDPPPGVPDDVAVIIGEEVVCATPLVGFDRFQPLPGRRFGIDYRFSTSGNLGYTAASGSGLVAEDLDGDGDIDLAFGNTRGMPRIYANDGNGSFEPVELPFELWATPEDGAGAHLAADLDGDGLPELIITSPGRVRVATNLGGMRFSDPKVVWELVRPSLPFIGTAAVGDIDLDGDLDLLVPGLDRLNERDFENPWPTSQPGTFDRLLRNQGGHFTMTDKLSPEGVPGFSFAATFTDRDNDGDPDILIAADRGRRGMPDSAFYRNDNAGEQLVNDAPEIFADLAVSAMGIATADFNEDGALDYCISDVRAIRCLVATPLGYVESAAAMGLRAPGVPMESAWFGWSLEAVDLDNDGELDMPVAAGLPFLVDPSQTEIYAQPDGIWQGTGPGSFVDRTADLGFDDRTHHTGLAVADLDGDGFVEIIIAANEDGVGPVIWQNHCGPGRWLELKLVGVDDNVGAFGARVEVRAQGRTRVQEIQSLRTFGQSPTRLHFGLGDAERVRVDIRWPDGARTELTHLPTNRFITVMHPG